MKITGNKNIFFFSQEPIKAVTGAVLTEKKKCNPTSPFLFVPQVEWGVLSGSGHTR